MGSVFFVFLKYKENVNLIKEIYDKLIENLFKNDGVVCLLLFIGVVWLL